jgi:hypothetical protein
MGLSSVIASRLPARGPWAPHAASPTPCPWLCGFVHRGLSGHSRASTFRCRAFTRHCGRLTLRSLQGRFSLSRSTFHLRIGRRLLEEVEVGITIVLVRAPRQTPRREAGDGYARLPHCLVHEHRGLLAAIFVNIHLVVSGVVHQPKRLSIEPDAEQGGVKYQREDTRGKVVDWPGRADEVGNASGEEGFGETRG